MQLKMNNLPDVSNITAWQASSGWFYITMYKVKGDSSSLMPRKLPPQVIDFQIIESDESIQLGIRIKQPIENHDFLLVKNSNTLVASLHYSMEYLAQLDTVKKMNLGQQNKEIHQEIRNWLGCSAGLGWVELAGLTGLGWAGVSKVSYFTLCPEAGDSKVLCFTPIEHSIAPTA